LPLLEIEDLSIAFVQYKSRLRQTIVRPMEGISLSLEKGSIMAVIGSSGSGKSLLAHAIMGILPENARVQGAIRYQGSTLDAAMQAKLRGRELALVPQSVTFLDPLMRAGTQVRETADGWKPVEEQRRIFGRYGLKQEVADLLPFQLSGGMTRRILVSTAAVSGAKLLIADEPTPGMHEADVQETQTLFRELAAEGCAVLLITHDIGAALQVADQVTVLYGGSVMETARAEDFTGNGEKLRHPYTKALWNALPQNGFLPVPGSQPRPGSVPEGCLYRSRCPAATEDCAGSRPALRELRGGNARCIHAT
jgi:peptide/nickel transport system ATP-binding protein